jgi:tyrosyl-tRNA synthetase
MPTSEFPRERLSAAEGLGLVTLMREAGIVSSNGDGFRAIGQGGVTVNGEKVTDPKTLLSEADFADGGIIIKKGKKTYHRVVLV